MKANDNAQGPVSACLDGALRHPAIEAAFGIDLAIAKLERIALKAANQLTETDLAASIAGPHDIALLAEAENRLGIDDAIRPGDGRVHDMTVEIEIHAAERKQRRPQKKTPRPAPRGSRFRIEPDV
jgi:hypothetical protein